MNTPGTRPRRGLSLAEILIASSIIAMLLLSVSMAYQASAQSIEANDRFVRASQTARISVRNIISAVRTSEACQVGDSNRQGNNTIADETKLSIILAGGSVVVYEFLPDERQLVYRIEDATSPVEVVMARNVEFVRFTGEIEPHPETGIRRTVRVLIEMQVLVEGQSLYLCGSSVPRREMIYAGGEGS